MSNISMQNVGVCFPVYVGNKKSIKNEFLNRATGGRLSQGSLNVVHVQALVGISIDLKDGDRLGLFGHNGSGKSTFLRTIAGVYAPTSGCITIDGRIASLLDLTLGMDPEATGIENIKLRCATMGLPRSSWHALVEEVSEFSGLGDFLRMPMRTYSSGMVMRLGFSVATSVSADIILMDEWLSVGDDAFRAAANNRLTQRIEKSAIFVLASQSKALLEEVCNRIITLEHGRVIDDTGVPL